MSATFDRARELTDEPRRSRCRDCGQRVLAVEYGLTILFAEVQEWVPLMRCPICQSVRDRGYTRNFCHRCNGTGWIGQRRPETRMLAIEVAWPVRVETYTVRYIGPRTKLRKGEAVHELHLCQPALAAA
jgi:hypothetical protein